MGLAEFRVTKLSRDEDDEDPDEGGYLVLRDLVFSAANTSLSSLNIFVSSSPDN